MIAFFKKNWVDILSILVVSSAISYGVSDYVEFTKAACVITPLLAVIYYFINKTPEELSKIEDLVSELDGIIGEQTQVIEEYEKIFDSQLVELPCVCGGNTFEGLFSPKSENIVECEKCKNKYRVDISYNSVLISQPLDTNKTMDQLIEEHIN